MQDPHNQTQPGQTPQAGAPRPEQQNVIPPQQAHPQVNVQPQALPGYQQQVDTSQQAVDRFAQLGGLEVAEMPESLELEQRRKATHDSLHESVSEVGGGSEVKSPKEDSDGLAALLRDANLSPRHLRFCFGGILALIVLIFVIWGGTRVVGLLSDAMENRVVIEDQIDDEEIEDDLEEDGRSLTEEEAVGGIFVEPDILSGILIGNEETEVDGSTLSGELLGEELSDDNGLAQMILDFADMFNLMEVDVNAMLDQSNNRRDTLEDYAQRLNYLIYLAGENVTQLESDNSQLADQFERAELLRDEHELRFFEQLNSLEAYAAVSSLNAFTSESQRVVEIRSQFLARNKLIEYFGLAIESMTARVTDVELNEEALVKGVQVIEVQGSDLNLILNQEEL
jgi:hypothetical protein